MYWKYQLPFERSVIKVTYLAEKEIKALLRVQHQRLAEPPLSLQITSSPERGMAEKKGKKNRTACTHGWCALLFPLLTTDYLALAGINHLATYCPDQSPRPSAVRVLQTYKACGQAHFSFPSPSPFPLAHFFTSHLLPRQNFLLLSPPQLPNRRWRPNMKLCTRTPKIRLHCRPLNKRGRARNALPAHLFSLSL